MKIVSLSTQGIKLADLCKQSNSEIEAFLEELAKVRKVKKEHPAKWVKNKPMG